MTHTIAVAGKGGTGKTTLCGLLIDYLTKKNDGLVLAVDADANSNLNEVLGIEVEETLGDIREDIAESGIAAQSKVPSGWSKQDYMDFRFNNAIVEQDNFDMLVMGRTQGKGCYCFVNGLLQAEITKFANNYRYIVVDNEAGMEHISRGILPKIDTLLLVSDSSRRGIQAVGRIAKLARDLKIEPKAVGLIVNRAPGGRISDGVREEIELQGLDLLGIVPHDDTVYEYDSEGKPTVTIPASAPVRVAFDEIVRKLNFN